MAPAPRPSLLLLNGSLRGEAGNTARLLATVAAHAHAEARVETLVLGDFAGTTAALLARLEAADAFVVGSGVYWNNWGTPLQRFLETVTAWETTPVFLGKPAAAVLSLDSAGGADVGARLLGTLGLLGCTVPPLCSVAVARWVVEGAAQLDRADVWQPGDLQVLTANVLLAARAPRQPWQRWSVKTTPAPPAAYAPPGLLFVDHRPWPALQSKP